MHAEIHFANEDDNGPLWRGNLALIGEKAEYTIEFATDSPLWTDGEN